VTSNDTLSRRTFTTGLVATLSTVVARAQDGRNFQIIVGYPPGGGSDVLARVLGEPLAKVLGRPVVIKNMPGAGGQIAASALLREGGDGLSILAINHPDLSMAVARGTVALKATDFQVVMVDVQDPRVFLVKADSTIDTFATFVSRAKAQPGKLAVSVTAGSAQELFAKWLFDRLGVDVTIVGYKGGAESSNALLAGDVAGSIGDDFARFNLRSLTKALFIGARVQSPRWPEAPTLTAALVPFGVTPPSPNFLSRYGVYVVPAAVKATDAAGYAKLQHALLQARRGPGFHDYIAKNKLQDLSIGKPGEEFESAFAADMVEIRRIR
jgi:tripartite-type tricarboxylate transporter receptor subunit TctC